MYGLKLEGRILDKILCVVNDSDIHLHITDILISSDNMVGRLKIVKHAQGSVSGLFTVTPPSWP